MPIRPATVVPTRRAFTLAVPLVLLAIGLAPAPLAAGPLDSTARVRALFEQSERLEGDEFWARVARIREIGDEVLPVARDELKQGAPRRQLAAAGVLLEAGDDDDIDFALLALEKLVKSAAAKPVRLAAMELLTIHGEPDEVRELLEERFENETDPQVQIPLARLLWELAHVTSARDRLVQLLEVRDLAVRREAALTLAEMDYFEGDVRKLLRELRDEPSPQGRRAAALSLVLELSRQLDRKIDEGEVLIEGVDAAKLLRVRDARIRELEARLQNSGSEETSGGTASASGLLGLLEEVVERVQANYVDPSRTERKALILAAIRGMVAHLDPFSAFMAGDDTQKFNESMSGEYHGIGAHVKKRPDQPLELRKILYGGPAHHAGLRAGDRVLRIDGVELAPLELDAVVDKLKGPKNSKIRLEVFRPGTEKTWEREVVRGRVEIPAVYSTLLPGKIGYVRLTKFGFSVAQEFIEPLDELEKRGLEALIIDLRDNPGGALDQAKEIVDQFVSGDLPIVTQKDGRGEEISTMPNDFRRANYPVVVLVNENSASASEIVSGALQDFDRARVIGKRTFGKGSVQRLIRVSKKGRAALGEDARLRLTVQYYYLPLGRCIHTIRGPHGEIIERGGVEPDVSVDAERTSAAAIEEMDRLHSDDRVLEYVVRHQAALKALFLQGRGLHPEDYPELEKLRTELGTDAPLDNLRRVVRHLTRRWIEDERGEDLACDFREDRQLQAAILDLLKTRGSDPQETPEYRGLGEEGSEAE